MVLLSSKTKGTVDGMVNNVEKTQHGYDVAQKLVIIYIKQQERERVLQNTGILWC